jgi:hypothetical protein
MNVPEEYEPVLPGKVKAYIKKKKAEAKGISLTKEGLIDGAKQAAEDGLSFDDYCELITKIIISGQTLDQVRGLLKSHGLDAYFEEIQ